ncbi:MAG: hypothetical protein C4306_09585, partial [Thermoleophilia bacterium]
APPPALPPPPPSPPALLAALTVTPTVVSPNGDGYADLPTISYVLSEKALVSATLTSEDGVVVATLFQDQRQSARKQQFSWPVDALPDGRYRLAPIQGGRPRPPPTSSSCARLGSWPCPLPRSRQMAMAWTIR